MKKQPKSSSSVLKLFIALSDRAEDNKKHLEKMKVVSADCLALFAEVSALHYLVQGTTFQDIHKITNKIYDFFLEQYDFFNERLVQLAKSPVKNIKEIALLTSVASELIPTDENRLIVVNTYSVCERLIHILQVHQKNLNELKKLASSSEDFVTEDYCIQKLYFTTKEIWQLKSRLSMQEIKK